MIIRLAAPIALLLAALWWSPPVFGQATGAITGMITDASGATVPGVRVDAINLTTAQLRTSVTAADGFYTIPLLSPATYQLKATLSGFRAAVREGLEVVINETIRADFQLEVGNVSDQVTVSDVISLVETKNATLGVVIDEKRVVDLPLNGRNFTQLGTLMPGVVAPPGALGGQNGNATTGGGIGGVTGGFNVNGMRNQSNNFLLDGASNNDTFNTGFVIRPPPDAIQEFKILTHSYDAEYGRSAGAVVNVVTRSGTNDWHGALWEFNRDDGLQAKNFFAKAKPELKQNQFGGAAGGPLMRDRLFMFSYVEGFRNTEGQTDTRFVLSAAQRKGDFSEAAPLRDPLTGEPFSGNLIPSNRIHPVAARLIDSYIPLPNSPGNRLVRAPDIRDTRTQIGTRVDYKLRNEHNFIARYIIGHTRNVNPLSGSNFAPAANSTIATAQDILASDTWVVHDDKINIVRASLNRINAQPTTSSGVNPADFGFAYTGSSARSIGLPFVSLPGFFTLGDSQGQFAARIQNVVTVADDFAWLSRSHGFKFGGEFRHEGTSASYSFDPNGDYIFSGQYSGSAEADFLLGFPALFRQATGDPNLSGSSWTAALYGQDQYRLGSRVTLNYGVRYEVNRPFVESRNRLNAFHPGQQSTVFPNAPTGLVYPGDEGIPRATYRTDTNNVAPRIAFIWDTHGDGRMSIRSAWGLFHDTLAGQGDFFQNVVAPPFQSITEVIFPLQITAPPFANPLQGVTGSGEFPPGLIFVGWGRDFTTPVAQHFNISLQRQVGNDFGIEIGYVRSRARNLPIYMEINPTTPILSPSPAVGPRLYPAFSLLRPTFSAAKSWYDSFQVSARLRSWRGLGVLASYTLGHAIDHISGFNIGGEPRPMLPVMIGNESTIEAALAREKGDALFDARHRFVITFTYELPRWQTRSPLGRLLLDGWQFNGIAEGQTGFPFTVVEPSNVSLTSLTNRPNMTCDPNTGGARTIAQWFNTGCFQRLTIAANAGQIGNEARGAVRGPGFRRVDVALIKNVATMPKHRLQLRIEAFNVFNSVRLGQPGNQAGTPTFGQITSAEDGRIVQVGIKYSF